MRTLKLHNLDRQTSEAGFRSEDGVGPAIGVTIPLHDWIAAGRPSEIKALVEIVPLSHHECSTCHSSHRYGYDYWPPELRCSMPQPDGGICDGVLERLAS